MEDEENSGLTFATMQKESPENEDVKKDALLQSNKTKTEVDGIGVICHDQGAVEKIPELKARDATESTALLHKQSELEIEETAKCFVQKEKQRLDYEQQLEQLRAALAQKDNMITLFQRENTILEMEKQTLRKEKELANKEKESTVIKFAIKEKLLLDAKKDKDAIEKQLAEVKKEVKNVSMRFQAVNEEKLRMTYMMDEKCNELRKCQRECEKCKTEYGHLESKLKYHVNKLSMEIESKQAIEKKLEDERNAPNKLEEKAVENLKVEFEANTILLKHEIQSKSEQLENLGREHNRALQMLKQLQEQLSTVIGQKGELAQDMDQLQTEHNAMQNLYSEEMLVSAKLRGQLDELQVLRTQNTLNEEKIDNLQAKASLLEEQLQDSAQDLTQLHAKEVELLGINKEMTESIVGLQNEICLLKGRYLGVEAENSILQKEKYDFDVMYGAMATQLQHVVQQKTEECQLLAKHLSEKTKLYEVTKAKLENVLGDYEASKHKHATLVKELQRELYKVQTSNNTAPSVLQNGAPRKSFSSDCRAAYAMEPVEDLLNENEAAAVRIHNSTHSGVVQNIGASSSESETMASSSTVENNLQGPSKKHMVERILRLQQASARQTEKIDFLENHTLSLVAELQKKSKVVQYYMMRDQAGALTTSKSDQNKTELAKYGNGVMSAIYNGIRGENKSMTLELSLEINKKLQSVLEDTLLKNITLKENLDILGLEVDNLTRRIRQVNMKE